MLDVWRWLQTDCHSGEASNLQSTLRGDGNRKRGAATRDGVTLSEARREKERTYPELVGPGARGRLVVLALEVGG